MFDEIELIIVEVDDDDEVELVEHSICSILEHIQEV